MADGRGLPREQYKRTYVLIPPGGDASLAALIMEQMWDAKRWTVGGSADDAGIGDLDVRQIIAISPGDWGGDLEAFFEEHYPGIAYWPLEYSSEYQLVGRLWGYGLKESGLELAYPVMHGTEREPYVTGEFGTWRTSYYHMGLDLRASWAAWGDEVLSATDGVVTKAGYYDNAGGFGWRVRVRTQAPDGRTAYIRYAHLVAGGIYVSVGDEVVTGQKLGRPDSTGASSADHLHVDVKVEGQYVDPALLMNWQQQTIPANFPLLGIHGRGGGDYLASQGVRGWCVDPVYMNEDYQALDYGDLADAGVQTVVNLRRGWSTDCGGRGTIPPPSLWPQFIESAIATIRDAKGVHAVTLFNEVNNPREWPKEGYQVQPEDVVYLYNEIWRGVKDLDVKVGPGALDPFHGPGSDCREWFRYLMANIVGAKVIGLHGYGRGPNVAKLDSEVKFGDDPLKWQYAAYFGCVQTFIDEIPDRFGSVPLLITECNHLWLQDAYWPAEGEATVGWDPNATDWIEAAFEIAAGKRKVAALVFYRWSGDDWRMHDKPQLLQKIVELNG